MIYGDQIIQVTLLVKIIEKSQENYTSNTTQNRWF
jgi:hypothetical protein